MSSEINGTARLSHMDLLKCLAMYFVLVFHGTLYAVYVYPDMPTAYLLRYFSRSMLATCVPLFFFVNGYLLLSRPVDLKKHTLRTLRMMILTCFWTVFLLVVQQPYYGEYFTWEELWKNCWQLKAGWNNQLWYLCTLVGIYFFFPLLKRTLDGDRNSFYWFSGVILVLAFGDLLLNQITVVWRILVYSEFDLGIYNNNPVFRMFNPLESTFGMGLAYFCLGGVAWSLEEKLLAIPAKWRNGIAVVGLLLSCGVWAILGWRFSLYQKSAYDLVWNGYYTVFTLCSVLCLYLLSLNYRGSHALIRRISANTLGIYLIHDLIHKALAPFAVSFAFMCTLPGTLVYSAVLLLISLGLCLVLKKLPVIRNLI